MRAPSAPKSSEDGFQGARIKIICAHHEKICFSCRSTSVHSRFQMQWGTVRTLECISTRNWVLHCVGPAKYRSGREVPMKAAGQVLLC